MRAIIWTPNANRSGKNDYTGAFAPESIKLAKALALPNTIRAIPENANVSTMEQAITEIVAPKQLDLQLVDTPNLSRFCVLSHGVRNTLCLGHMRPQGRLFESWCDALATASREGQYYSGLVVTLYCCSLAGGNPDGSFADRLRWALRARGLDGWIDAHTTVGHTTKNPYVRRFDLTSSAGSYWLVQPGSLQWKAWRSALQTPFRFEFSERTTIEIARNLDTTEVRNA